jgi:predicted DNA-binding WGR domain protein
MPRYEYVDGASKKFWEIALDGTSFTTTYGRIGTDGQTSTKEWDDEERAKKEHDKLIAEKVKKGYELVSGDAPKKKTAPAKANPSKPAAKTKGRAAVFDDEGDDEDDEAPKKKTAPAKAAPTKAAPAKKGSAKKGVRHFEFVDGSSSKFWEIELDGTSFTTRYGKIGTDGQTSTKEWDDEERAKKEYDKLVGEKTKKGYEEK